ncbi:MAG TPA: peptidylprolyl isomerase [Gemmataceae bacterium]|nr:peptidylprolyl isomerase [Gemmataceae bacterium]
MRWTPRRCPRTRLRVEPLEGREVPATIGTGRAFWFLASGWDPQLSAKYAGIGAPAPTPTPSPTVPKPTTPTLTLAAASDTGAVGDKATTMATVTLVGTTSPGATVRLIQTGATATADTTGAFSFTGVALDTGSNTFKVRARNAAGGTSTFTTAITRSAAPTVAHTLNPVSVAAGASATVDLAGTFDDVDITNTQIRFETPRGPINVELFDRQAPKTVANFLNYVGDGEYTDSIFHRSAKLPGGTPFVLQGGGFTFEAGPPVTLAPVPTDPPVQNEPDATNRSNVRGTLAMAKLPSGPDTATSQFFFNLGNNSANLDNQNGGFTVFGKVMGPTDQTVVDVLAAMPTQNQGTAADLPDSQKGVFTDIPLPGYTGTDFPTDSARSNYAIVNGVTITRQTEVLTYSVVSNTNPAIATATVTDNRVTFQGLTAGTATITIRATDRSGATVETPVTVTVTAAPVP